MEAGPQLLYYDIKPLRRSLAPSLDGFNTRPNRNCHHSIAFRSQRSDVFAVAAEPKSGSAWPSSRSSLSKTSNGTANTRQTSSLKAPNGATNGLGKVSGEIKRVRKQLEEDEQLAILMRGLRGQNLPDSQFADENVRLRLVEVYSF